MITNDAKANNEENDLFDFITYGSEKLQLFLLVMLRTSGLFMTAPIIGHESIPRPVKAGLVILLSMILVLTMDGVAVPQVTTLVELAGIAFKELLIGLIIGFVFMLIFLAVQGAGSIAGYQVGLHIANAFDPTTQTDASLIGQFWMLLAFLIFMGINGHHLVIRAFIDSYQVIGPGLVQFTGSAGEEIIKYTGYLLLITLKIVAPVMVTLFLVDIALGTLARMMPTMNVFFVGIPVKLAAGFVILALSLPVFSYVLEKSIGYFDHELHLLFLSMGKA